jgi:lipopolysaccharide export LptBFGC system permease protein LptF
MSFLGENQISTFNNTNITNCETSCLSNTSCSGATFNTISNNCTISSGSGNIVPTQYSKAIVKEVMYYSYKLKKLNAKLMDINQQMMNNSNNSYNKYQKSQTQSKQQDEIVNINYQTLLEERINIEKMIREYEILNKAYENSNINITSNYYSYIFLMLIVILLIFIFLTFI